ncbi:RNase A-like domain-containing protein [Acetobacter sp. DmW_136]|uniref:RNase A-like domain-containing protein n=1 Tax=Acetobacter sp. DmW_136 TaxID=2591091 RepID=UPI001EE37AF1|nr:RNase A-like domain-containing protein [Acetobacter sp. DmW_136]
MSNTNQHPALTFVMSEHQLVSILRRHLPSQKTINRAEGLAMIGFGAAEMAGATGLLAAPEPALSKVGGITLAAHGADMMAAGRRAWNTGTPPQTQTERTVRAAALRAHASPAVAGLVGAAADALIPSGLLYRAGSFAATRAIRVASADASRLTFRQADITTEHFHRPSTYSPQPPRPPTDRNLLLPHRQKRLDLDHHEAPPHNRKAGGHVLLKHVDPTDEYIERRFTKEKQSIVSFFTSKEDAERAIHKALKDNSSKIDHWRKNAKDGNKIFLDGYTSGRGTVVIESANRQRKTARHIQVTIVKKVHNGMSYYVQTVKLYHS